ncbi:adhesion G protein-coupled receptor B3-like, partial [Corticium candelabrum]|uniref:adhesion G protein-coupled receptor B3-like n=1 Tax=Corticium candelabrum TaxID=121492 RepID=UPI002E258AF0
MCRGVWGPWSTWSGCMNSQWQSWTAWSACSVTCGQGKRYHRRSCVPAKCGGVSYCKGAVTVYGNCNSGCCPVHGSWGSWGRWSACSASCGAGTQKRIRTCIQPKCGGQNKCVGSNIQTNRCQKRCCPVSGSWKAWSAWAPCSASCGNGVSRRYRLCAPPRCGGRDVCGGRYNQTQATVCKKGCCPVDGGWAAWGQWAACSASCGSGRKTRTRQCILPKCGGKDFCVGLSRQRVNCQNVCCTGKGTWTAWSGWSACSVTCGSGTRTRVRQCKQSDKNCDKATCSGSSDQRQ